MDLGHFLINLQSKLADLESAAQQEGTHESIERAAIYDSLWHAIQDAADQVGGF